MFTGSSFGKTVDVLQRTMDTSLLRREVISNNIANAETPDFKRSDVSFETELKNALASEQKRTLPAKVTDSRHMSFNESTDYRSVRPRRVLDYLTTSKNNGNNVDIEQEMMSATENQMMYELLSTSVGFQFSQINIVTR
ncbi:MULTISPECIES: flagellar basal body rod protein FlgB [unclassified Oceanispirochaeta]|uniref:flagellar basal body rod protein FlgB n=1 Tax=unclassified Oceanispirochaeta TaxID=2635722 RepID=UPI000E08F065|nr:MULTISPECIES: flagellar basal body rod protein FlgB [unclassified Oceanispirochaeta]MBF9016147.1 flagellar basal body rod protein FlgB [Oceanispirochaeta sp. M2]NPD72609.1 flagellar basal body rod protein FlgB [Oceanispirochaeta sp. M1]RDG31761.1 flagellar basal body rod protein FlgB [Oceanispirochaeta sp. M1]